MINKKVSVIIPAYNAEKYLSKCLNTLINQSYSNLEIIIVNDGSTDLTKKCCEEYQKKDSRIRLANLKNGGVSKARNYGIEMATGEYLTFVDSDDYVDRRFIEFLVNAIQYVQLSIVDYSVVNCNNIITKSVTKESSKEMTNVEALENIFKEEMYGGYVWNKLFVRKVLIENNIRFRPDIKIWEDLLFCTEYLSKIDKVNYLRESLYFYLQRKDSTINSLHLWKEYTQIKAIREMCSFADNISACFSKQCFIIYFDLLLSKCIRKRIKIDDIEDVKKTINKLKELNAHMTIKMYIKMFMIYTKYYLLDF